MQLVNGDKERMLTTISEIKRKRQALIREAFIGILRQIISKEQLISQIALVIEKSYRSRLIGKFLRRLRVEKSVMRKYDHMAGRYIRTYEGWMSETEKRPVMYNNTPQYRLIKDIIHAREDYVADLITSYSAQNCIEIGAGELTFIAPVAAKIKDCLVGSCYRYRVAIDINDNGRLMWN